MKVNFWLEFGHPSNKEHFIIVNSTNDNRFQDVIHLISQDYVSDKLRPYIENGLSSDSIVSFLLWMKRFGGFELFKTHPKYKYVWIALGGK